MSMKINHELPLPADLKAQFPLDADLAAMKQRRDAEILSLIHI